MAEKNIVENRPAEDIKERFSSNETVNTVMNGLGKVVDYPMGVVGNLTVKNNAVDASVKPGKALGQSMLMGIVALDLVCCLVTVCWARSDSAWEPESWDRKFAPWAAIW